MKHKDIVTTDRQMAYQALQLRHGSVNVHSKRGIQIVHRYMRSYRGE